MKINEKKLVEFLKKHIGDNYRMIELLKESGACEKTDGEDTGNGDLTIDIILDHDLREIAEKNGYIFNSHHHDNEFCGMPWVYDFFIETAEAEQ